MTNIKEVWLPIKGYEGFYEISSIGRVKSLARIDCMGQKRKERFKKPSNDKDGYHSVSLSKDRVNRTFREHQLVAINFIENPLNKPCVNHINGIKTDNRVENLEWCTNKENIEHAIATGLRDGKGVLNYGCVLTEKEVLEIYGSEGTNKEVSKKYNVGELAVNRIRIGYTWAHLTGHVYKQKKASCLLDKEFILKVFNADGNYIEISTRLNIPKHIVACIKRGQSYSNITGKKHVKIPRKHHPA